MNATIKCYRPGQQLFSNNFFILNKGANSGKPSFSPFRNCFVVSSESDEEIHQLYYLCFALWKTNQFQQFILGSVIPFIRIDDVKDILQRAAEKLASEEERVNNYIATLASLDAKILQLEQQRNLFRLQQAVKFQQILNC